MDEMLSHDRIENQSKV